MSDKQQAIMLAFAKDLPNICSLLGLLSAILGIYFATEGNFPKFRKGKLQGLWEGAKVNQPQ
jgi:hypothetical protein